MSQRKSIGSDVKIRTSEKAKALLRKTWEPTKKQWLDCEKHTNQRESNGLNVKSIETNKKTLALM